MSRRTLTRLAAAGALVLAACSDSTSPDRAPLTEAEISADVAVSAGSAAASEVVLMRGDMTQAGMAGARIGDNCQYSLAEKRWECAVATENGLQITRTIAFFSAGEAVPAYSATATDSIQVHATAAGTIVRDRGTVTVDDSRSVTISGLTGAETQRTVNGAGTRTENAQVTGDRGTRTYAGTVTNQILSVVYPVGGGWPLSGSLVHDVNATMTHTGATTGSRSISRHVVITFNGTALVPMTVGTLSCTLNLETRQVSCER